MLTIPALISYVKKKGLWCEAADFCGVIVIVVFPANNILLRRLCVKD